MGNYYFLAASLPPLVFGQKPEITFTAFRDAAEINLHKEDYEKMVLLRRMIDFENVRFLLRKFPIDHRGNFNEIEIDECLLTQTGLPDYFFDFFSKYEKQEDIIRNFAEIFSIYFAEEIPRQKGFVKRFLTFERESRIVIAALRAKECKRDVMQELQFEEFSDSIVLGILAQKDAEHYDPPLEYQELKEIFLATGGNPLERYERIEEYRFAKIEELVEAPLFSIDWILAYMMQLMIVERFSELDIKKAQAVFQDLTAL